MSKPNGIAFTFVDGMPSLRTTTASMAEDAIWNAVEEAIHSGVTPSAFANIAEQAWRRHLTENMRAELRAAEQAFSKPIPVLGGAR